MSAQTDLADTLQQASQRLITMSPLMPLLSKLGRPVQTGSSLTGLMAYPDIDFSVQTTHPRIQDAIDLTSTIFNQLKASTLKITDFGTTPSGPSYYVGIDFQFDDRVWHIDATVTLPGPIITNPPELAGWLQQMTAEQRETILMLKKELIAAKRYMGAQSQPPYTFRSIHVYEAVLRGGARNIKDLGSYFKNKQS